LGIFVAKPFRFNTKKDEGSKQQGGKNLSKKSSNIGVHSEGCPNIYTRLLMSNDIKVLVWGRLSDSSLRPLPLWHTGLHSLYPLLLYSYMFDVLKNAIY
jgi:hypothetical protein